MKKAAFTISFLLAAALPSIAQAKIFTGTDKEGRPCSASIENLRYGKTVMLSQCDFDMDGAGPWCSTKKDIPTAELFGNGVFSTASGTEAFTIADPSVRYNDPSYGFAATASSGATVVFTVTASNQIIVSEDFLTPYGRTLTTQQINQALMNRNSNVPYQQLYDQFFTNETCTIQAL